MDLRQPLPGALVIGLVHVPFVWEVALQLRLAARLYETLPPAVRQSFPDAPAGSRRLFLGSARFQRAFWSFVVRDDDDGDANDGAAGAEIAVLKLALRRSMRRKIVVATLGFAVVIGLLVAGWRPYLR